MQWLNQTRRSLARHACMALMVAAGCLGAAQAQPDPRLPAARAVGKVVWYTSVAPDELRKEIVDGFKAKTGLEVTVFYGGTGTVFSRLVTERKTQSFTADLVTLGDVDLVEELDSQKVLRRYLPSDVAAVQDAYKEKNGVWTGICFWGLTKAINTNALKPATAPQAWADLAAPSWKGKVVISDPARSAAGLLLLKAMVKDKGWTWVEQMLRNDPLIIAIAPGIDQALANGERQVATSVTSFLSETMKAKAPVQPVGDVLFTSPLTVSLVTEAPNPKGAELLADYLVSKEAGEMFRKYGWFSSRGDVAGPFGFPSSAQLKVVHRDVDIGMKRQEILDRYNQVLQASKK
jgi:iron(III) transport system substrate-binding protein